MYRILHIGYNTNIKLFGGRNIMEKKEFLITFRITKTVVFNVEYYTLGSNKEPHFATSVSKFNRPKTDWTEGGQCQERLLTGKALLFWKKWNDKHLENLSKIEYETLIADLEELKEFYIYEEKILDETQKPYYPSIPFYKIKELSMLNEKLKTYDETRLIIKYRHLVDKGEVSDELFQTGEGEDEELRIIKRELSKRTEFHDLGNGYFLVEDLY